MKREVWKWEKCNEVSLLIRKGAEHNFSAGAASIQPSIHFYSWRTWEWPEIGGVCLDLKNGNERNEDDAILFASVEIKRQLAMRGVRCEIRRVKR